MFDIKCADVFDYLKNIKSNSIDLVVTDPPYCINYKDWDKKDFVEFTDKWVSECFRILKLQGTMWSFMSYQQILEFVPLLKKYGIVHLENWVVWARQKGRMSSKHLKSSREDILHITKSNNFTWHNLKMLRDVVAPYVKDGVPRGWFINEEGRRVRWTGLGNVWVYTAPQYNSILDKQVHPAQKPTMLIERLIRLSSNENDIVLDPFVGSGTTALACKNSNRNFMGCDNNIEYVKITKDRLGLI
jgi:DNA modification methylase